MPFLFASTSSSGLGRRFSKPVTRVRIPSRTPTLVTACFAFRYAIKLSGQRGGVDQVEGLDNETPPNKLGGVLQEEQSIGSTIRRALLCSRTFLKVPAESQMKLPLGWTYINFKH